MKLARVFLYMLCLVGTNVNAAMVWTDNNPWGAGLNVDLVYPSFAERAVMFKADGMLYQYKWDANQSEMTPNAQAVYSMLLTAFTTGQRVSIYYNDAESGQINFTLINLHN